MHDEGGVVLNYFYAFVCWLPAAGICIKEGTTADATIYPEFKSEERHFLFQAAKLISLNTITGLLTP